MRANRSCLVSILAIPTLFAASVRADSNQDCSFTPPAHNQILAYPIGQAVPECQMPLHFVPAELGGTVLQGAADLFMRFDYNANGVSAGVFEAKATQAPFKVLVIWPFNEHATIITGQVTLTDSSGVSRVYGPGDSYFMQGGDPVLWEQNSRVVQKSFIDVVPQ